MPNVKYEFVLNADSITGNYLKISNENSIEATLTLQPGLATGDYTYSIKVIATKQNGKNELTFNYKLKIVNEIPNFNINDNTPQIKYGYTTKT
jgi:hypothetical protein